MCVCEGCTSFCQHINNAVVVCTMMGLGMANYASVCCAHLACWFSNAALALILYLGVVVYFPLFRNDGGNTVVLGTGLTMLSFS